MVKSIHGLSPRLHTEGYTRGAKEAHGTAVAQGRYTLPLVLFQDSLVGGGLCLLWKGMIMRLLCRGAERANARGETRRSKMEYRLTWYCAIPGPCQTTPLPPPKKNKYFELKTRGAAAPTRNTCSLRSQLCHSQ